MKLLPVVALLLLAGCTRPYWQQDEEVLGVQIDYGVQQDRDAMDDLLIACAITLGDGRALSGARVKYLADNAAVGRDCQPAPPGRGEIAECWSTMLDDLVLVAAAPLLANTATCHGLAHRVHHYAHGQVLGAEDYYHCDRPFWDRLGVPKATGPCR